MLITIVSAFVAYLRNNSLSIRIQAGSDYDIKLFTTNKKANKECPPTDRPRHDIVPSRTPATGNTRCTHSTWTVFGALGSVDLYAGTGPAHLDFSFAFLQPPTLSCCRRLVSLMHTVLTIRLYS